MSLGGILGAIFGTPSGRGYVGELKVSAASALALPRSIYTRFHEVTLRAPDGTTQIDHIFVLRYGVFVVETKNMSGWIFGNERDRQWTQRFRNGHKTRLQNPLRQNYRHTKAVGIALADLHIPGGCKVRGGFRRHGETEDQDAGERHRGCGFRFLRPVVSRTGTVRRTGP